MSSAEVFKNFKAAFEISRLSRFAETFCENRLGGLEGNEIVFAGLIVALAICETSEELLGALESVSDKIGELDNNYAVVASLDEIEATLADLRDHFG